MSELKRETALLILNHFEDDVDEDKIPASGKEAYQLMRRFLIERIEELISSDFEKLLFILYRIDVREDKVKRTLKNNSLEKGPELLADLIIERQLMKQQSREEHKGRHSEEDDEVERW